MSVLRFRRDRRQRDPFAGTPLDRRPAPQAPAAPDYATRIDVNATLASLTAQAQAETPRTRPVPAAAPWGPWDQPGNFPEALRSADAGWYGWSDTAMDVPPAHTRRYVPDPLTAQLPRSPLSFAADFAQLPVFRAACRAAGHAPGGLVRATQRPAPPDFRIGELMHANFAGMLAMHVTERAA